MALQVPNPPAQGLGIIREALSSAMNQRSVAASAFAEAASEELTTAAYPVYFAPLSDLVEGRLLEAARLKGWRYLIFEQDRPVAAAELRTDGDEFRFSNVNRGPFVASTIEGVTFAESLDVVQNEDYELRALEVSAVYLVSLWLHGDEDLLIPLRPAPEQLEPLTVYREQEVIERLRAAGEMRLNTDNSPLPL